MSSSDGGATTWAPGSSFGEGAPANSPKRRKIAATNQQTAVPLYDRICSTNGDPDEEPVDLMAIHEAILTNMDQFFPEPVQ